MYGVVVGRDDRRPEFFSHVARRRPPNNALEAAHLFIAEGEVSLMVMTFVIQFFRAKSARTCMFSLGAGRAHEIRIGFACDMSSAAARLRIGGFVARRRSRDGEQFERGQRAEDHVDIVAFDQFLRLFLVLPDLPPVSRTISSTSTGGRFCCRDP